MSKKYTCADLDAARAEYALFCKACFDNDSSNPDPRAGTRKKMLLKINEIEDALKELMQIPRTEEEIISMRLDATFPEAKSNDIVYLDGTAYKRRFSPVLKKRRRGNTVITSWDRWWEPVD